MKILMKFKTPDAVSEGINSAGIESDSDEYDSLYEEICKICRYGEYVTIVYDTVTKQFSVQ